MAESEARTVIMSTVIAVYQTSTVNVLPVNNFTEITARHNALLANSPNCQLSTYRYSEQANLYIRMIFIIKYL